MSKFKRIWNVFTGLFIILVSVMMLAIPDLGYVLALIILGLVLLISGIKQLIYFFSMGIHMVGGKIILYRALLIIDMGIFTLTINGIGQRYIMLYFVMYYFLAGVVSAFRVLESRRLESGTWKMNLVSGIYDFMIVLLCLINNNSESMMLKVLCMALIVSALTRISRSFRKSAIVYIQ